MKLEIDPVYAKSRMRKQFWARVFFSFLIAGAIAKAVSSGKISGYIIPGFAAIVLTRVLYDMHRNRIRGATSFAEIYTSNDDRLLNVRHLDTLVTITLAEVKKITLQYRKDRLSSILLKAKSDQDVRIEGYLNINALAEILKARANPEIVKTAKWYHG